MYESSERELAKDAAVMANAAGGWIIFASQKWKRADTLRGVKLTDNQRGWMFRVPRAGG